MSSALITGVGEQAEGHDASAAKRLPPDERRRHLTEVALEVFAKRGYSETELSDVADAAGIRRPLLYHYFGGKEDLYLAVLELACRSWRRGCRSNPGAART